MTTGTQAALHLDLLGFSSAGSSVRITNVQLLGPDGNHAPVANADSYTTRQDHALSVGVLGNDTDAENDPLSPRVVTQPAHGTVSLNADGSFLYTPAAGFSGPDSFTYQASDGQLSSPAATVTIIVNEPPVMTAGNLFLSSPAVDEGSSVSLTGAFSDPNTQAHTVTIDWGDGSTPDTQSLAIGATAIPATRHTYGDEPAKGSAYHVTVTVNDGFVSAAASVDVTVNNVTPVVAPMPAVTINQGDTLGSAGSFFDPSNDTWTATVDYGDGSGVQPLSLNADQTFVLNHAYDDPGAYTVTIRVSDDEGLFGTGTQSVTVNPNRLVVHVGLNASLQEGDTLTRTGNFTDVAAGPWSGTVDYGDGTGLRPLTINGANETFALDHTFGHPGQYLVTVRVTDQDGRAAEAHFSVAVSNVIPAVALGTPITLDEGDTFLRGGSFADPGQDTWTATVDYGDGSGAQSLALNPDKTFTLAHKYTVDGDYKVTVTVRDSGTILGVAQTQVQVLDVSPEVSVGGAVKLNEGDRLLTGGQFSDPGADTWTATIDYGDGTQSLKLLPDHRFQLDHVYPRFGSFEVTVSVIDQDGHAGSATFPVAVKDVPPLVQAGGNTSIFEGKQFVAPVLFRDPGADVWSATVDYGDSSGKQAVSLISGNKSFILAHNYADNGTFVVTVAVADDGGAAGGASLRLTVVNLPPVVQAALDRLAGTANSFVAHGLAFDAGQKSVRVEVDFGDGTGTHQFVPGSDNSFSFAHTYAHDGKFRVTVDAEDRDGAVTQSTFTVVINPAATPVAGPSPEFTGFVEDHVQFAGPEVTPSPSANVTDVVFVSFTEPTLTRSIDTLTGGSNPPPDLPDGGNKGNPTRGVGDDSDDPFWPWLEKKVPPPVKPRPVGGTEDGEIFPNGSWEPVENSRAGIEAAEAFFTQRAAQETRAPAAVTPSPASAEPERPQKVEIVPPGSQVGEQPAERGLWQTLVGCLLAVAGLLGLCWSSEEPK